MAINGSPVERSLREGKLQAGWGGVLDLLEEETAPGKAKRHRCTVHMDTIPEESGRPVDPSRFAFWTAEHCLKFDKARSAELNVFDPAQKRYLRFPVRLDELDRIIDGKKLFERHVNTRVADYLAAAARPSRGLIDRGIPSCKSDTQQQLSQNPNAAVVCSSVLDLARLEGRVHESAATRADVIELLGRLNTAIRQQENLQIVSIQRYAELLTTQEMSDIQFWLRNWRTKVSKLTQWRSFEGFAQLIEDVRTTCAAGVDTGVCHPEVREFFSTALMEYNDAGATGPYPNFLQAEVNAPMDGTKHNLPWLLQSQKSVQKLLPITGAALMGTNFAIPSPQGRATHAPSDTLGTKGPLFYAAAPIAALRTKAEEKLHSNMVFNDKTILYTYDRELQQGETFLMQPGDSGSVVVVGNIPIGVVSTVNGTETSGGAAILPLPEIFEEEQEEQAIDTTKGSAISCK